MKLYTNYMFYIQLNIRLFFLITLEIFKKNKIKKNKIITYY